MAKAPISSLAQEMSFVVVAVVMVLLEPLHITCCSVIVLFVLSPLMLCVHCYHCWWFVVVWGCYSCFNSVFVVWTERQVEGIG